MALKYLLFLFTMTISAASVAEDIPKLRMISEENPPFNFTKNGDIQGIAVELLAKMMQKVGANQDLSEIEMMSWEYGYNLVQENKDSVLFSTTRTEERENLFKWVCPIAIDKTQLVGLNSSNIVTKSKSDLMLYRIGTVRNSAGEQLLLALGIPPVNLVYTTYASFLKTLTDKKVDLIAFNLLAVKKEAQYAGLNPDDYESTYLLNESELCYAFNKSINNAQITKLQGAMNEIVSSGEHKGITAKYIRQ